MIVIGSQPGGRVPARVLAPGGHLAQKLRHCACGWLLFAFARPALGQSTSEAGVSPPALSSALRELRTSQPLPADRPRSIELLLVVAPDGHVKSASVVAGLEPELDASAVAAAERLTFEPARRGAVPVAARIRFSYPVVSAPFEPESVPEAPLSAPPMPSTATPPGPSPRTAKPAAATLPEVTVQGDALARRLRRSAEAVHVVETEKDRARSADLGEVLARSSGVSVRRAGGMGSNMRFALNGLGDEHVRFFIDGIPLEAAGFPFGMANVPVDLLSHVEIYRGVVPIRFGADALGGAVNLATGEARAGRHGSVSYEAGSFGTYRAALGAHSLSPGGGAYARVNAFGDYANNDYLVRDVVIAQLDGSELHVDTPRFHDRYRAAGVGLEGGVVDRPWARYLVLRGFATHYDQELQHDLMMANVFGRATRGETSLGASARYAGKLARGWFLAGHAGYTQGRGVFRDLSRCKFDWLGRCAVPNRRIVEVVDDPTDRVSFEHTLYGRAVLSWLPAPEHSVRFAAAPQHAWRHSRNDASVSDPEQETRYALTSHVAGLEYEARPFDGDLQNVVFAKSYYLLPSIRNQSSRDRELDHALRRHYVGYGDSARYLLTDWLYVKASYEYSVRMPRADELFGDGSLVRANYDLLPERSHNANLELALDLPTAGLGDFRAGWSGFLRYPRDLILQIGAQRQYVHLNVHAARSVGFESALGWSSPGGYFSLDGNATWQDLRNTSSQGTFGAFEGDRLPNRPYVFANGSARVTLPALLQALDEVSLVWDSRFVDWFYLGWQKLGDTRTKLRVPAQFTHTAALGYKVTRGATTTQATFEIQNLTDAKAQDFYGTQRPGRGFFFKGTVER